MDCQGLEQWLDGELGGQDLRAMEAHAATCAACREHKERWVRARAQIDQWASVRPVPTTDPFAQARLVAQARKREDHRPVRWRLVLSTVALLCFCAGAGGYHLWSAGQPRGPGILRPRLAALPPTAAPAQHAPVASPIPSVVYSEGSVATEGSTVEVRGDGRAVFRLGGDVFGLDSASTARILAPEAGIDRVELMRGAIAVSAAPRLEGTSLHIRSGAVDVVVVGTRFLVDRHADGSTKVEVDEGVVEVRAAMWSERVGAGEVLVVDAGGRSLRRPTEVHLLSLLHPAPWPAPAPPKGELRATAGPPMSAPAAAPAERLSDLRRRLASGDSSAATAVEQWNASHPDDAEGWALRARLEARRQGGAAEAQAWREALRSGPPSSAIRYRYELGRTLSGLAEERAEGIRLLQEVLALGAGPLDADTRLRLAGALDAAGRPAEALVVWQSIEALHPGTPEAGIARASQSDVTPQP